MIFNSQNNALETRGCGCRNRMVVGCTTTYAISAYHHYCCEFKSRSGRSVQHHDLRQVGGFLGVLLFLPPMKLMKHESDGKFTYCTINIPIYLDMYKRLYYF